MCKEFTWHKESSNQAKYCLMFSAHKGKEQNNATVSGPQKCPGKNIDILSTAFATPGNVKSRL